MGVRHRVRVLLLLAGSLLRSLSTARHAVWSSPVSPFAKRPTVDHLTEAKGYLKFDPYNCSYAAYVCGDCEHEHAERDKYAMVRAGQCAISVEVAETRGFHLSELYSTLGSSWLQLARIS